MKRVLAVLLLLCLLTSCTYTKNPNDKEDDNRLIVVYPDSEKRETVNGYRKTDIVFICNTKTKKFHLPECKYAQTINEDLIMKEKDREKIINDGYVPCKNCNP